MAYSYSTNTKYADAERFRCTSVWGGSLYGILLSFLKTVY